ncbi:hypothetical protein EYF80_012315 [Liparis tanakae]|uniref:Uncharacterized protein n=1 Tax=Liparis tanakae TaxID=230148 RepID=A0A4Z2IIE7_9TELE|nr:hypothetical protein EYF80_012315 [Liparis tanakae]
MWTCVYWYRSAIGLFVSNSSEEEEEEEEEEQEEEEERERAVWDAGTRSELGARDRNSSWSREEEVLPSRLTPLLRPGLFSADALPPPPPPPATRGLAVSVCCFRVCSLARGMMSQAWGRCHTVRWVEAL